MENRIPGSYLSVCCTDNTIPAFAGPTLWAYVVGLTISFLGGLLLTLLFGIKDPKAEMSASK